ncbi:hypothetical protein BJX76DRAFT_365791 [Aspergillus varians]
MSDDDDVKTVYSDASSIAPLTKEAYLSELADNLYNNICAENRDGQIMERISHILLELLKAFALKVGHDAPSQMHRDVMVFVHKNRSAIVDHFKKRWSHEKQGSPKPPGIDSTKMPLDQLMALWSDRLDEPANQILPTLAEAMHIDEDVTPRGNDSSNIPASNIEKTEQDPDADKPSQLSSYRDLIFKSSGYQWLLGTLHREFTLTPSEPYSMEAINREVMRALPPAHQLSRKRSAQSFTMKFIMEWDPLSFIDEQMYDQPPDEVFGKIITITGSDCDTQALPCKAYLIQTWPSTGALILEVLKDAACGGHRQTDISVNLPDNTRVSAWFDVYTCSIEASGPACSIAEVGEQLAWLGAALRSSPSSQGVAYCTPAVTDIQTRDASEADQYDAVCYIDFMVRVVDKMNVPSNGKCWHDMFRNPIAVEGYPILRRSQSNTGLEISLDMMTGLVQTSRVNTLHDGTLAIKGFSVMLVPTRRSGDLLIWHLLCNKNRDWISYPVDTRGILRDVSEFLIENARHIVGWCSDAKSYGLRMQIIVWRDPGCSHMRGPRDSEAFVIGYKDIPVHVSRHSGYILKLRWLSKKFVVLWDEDDKRGWLVNGTSALLHILRASLQYDSEDDFKDVFLFKPDQMIDPAEHHEPSSAIRVLLNPTNRRLKLYPREKDGYFCLEDRVESIYNVLEQMIYYQSKPRVPLLPRGQLDGWDFKDLATDQDPFHLRSATIKTLGKGWVDLTRDIHAVTLFGRGFGELIQPIGDGICGSCAEHWIELPKEKYYLAVSAPDITRIMDLHGSQRMEQRKLTQGLIWHSPGDILIQCQCAAGRRARDHDPVQVLVPSTWSTPVVLSGPVKIPANGAVIFGHNQAINWFWKDFGFPSEGEAMSPPEEPEIQFHDSAIGQSLNSSDEISIKSTNSAILTPKDYTVGIVCALHKELLAVRALFDDRHDKEMPIPSQDTNHYSLGRIGKHNVVAACLPSGRYGTNSAADVVSHMARTFPVKFCLLVGIGGGVPSKEHDIRLGDVVVSQPGVIQYDIGKKLQGGEFEARGILHRPPRYLMTAISSLEADPDHSPKALQSYISHITTYKPEYKRPTEGKDILFAAEYSHCNPEEETCAHCKGPRVKRRSRRNKYPKVHYGLIASGNQVIKDALMRDQLAKEKKFLCFEMEAAGVMDTVECLVIRGICDYADSHKNDIWQEYASATAAAYAKLLLSVVRRPGDSESLLNNPQASLPSIRR